MSFLDLFRRQSSNKISDKQLKEMLESSNSPLLIDVRTPQEYSGGHIPQSKNIPLQSLEASIKKMGLKLDSPMVVYCQSGMRASEASKILYRLGFKEVYTLGGIGAWSYGLER